MLKSSGIIEFLEPLIKLKKEGGICASVNAVQKLQEKIKFVKEELGAGKLKDDLLWLNHTECKLLGIALSAQKVDSYDQSMVTHTVKDFLDSERPQHMTFGVDILQETQYITKTGPSAGMPRADLLVTDSTGKMKVKIWSDLYKDISSICVEHNSIILTGKRGYGYFKEFLVASAIVQAK